jgi:hypothetical protein
MSKADPRKDTAELLRILRQVATDLDEHAGTHRVYPRLPRDRTSRMEREAAMMIRALASVEEVLREDEVSNPYVFTTKVC